MAVGREQQRGVGVLRQAVGPRRRAQVQRRVRDRVVVDRPQRHLAEGTGERAGGGACRRPDVDDRARVDLLAGLGVVERGAVRLDDELADEALAPAVDPVHVVVPEDVVQLHVGIPAVLDELGAGALAGGVVVAQRLGQRERPRGPVDGGDLVHLDGRLRDADREPAVLGELLHARRAGSSARRPWRPWRASDRRSCRAGSTGRRPCRRSRRRSPGRRTARGGCAGWSAAAAHRPPARAPWRA